MSKATADKPTPALDRAYRQLAYWAKRVQELQRPQDRPQSEKPAMQSRGREACHAG